MNSKPLVNPYLHDQFKNYVLIAGGPSLDYWLNEIEALSLQNTLFFLTDVVALKFIQKYPKSRRMIFSLESRIHLYLKGLEAENIAFYYKANKANVDFSKNRIFLFHFDFDPEIEYSTRISSPGTVAGAIFYWVISELFKKSGRTKLHLFGLDLAYPDNQMYNRLSRTHYKDSYWNRKEKSEWIMVLKRSAWVIPRGGFLIRTSEEFKSTRENLEIFIEKWGNKIEIYDYSPLGIGSNYVKKMSKTFF